MRTQTVCNLCRQALKAQEKAGRPKGRGWWEFLEREALNAGLKPGSANWAFLRTCAPNIHEFADLAKEYDNE